MFVVAGVTGHVGSVIARALLKKGQEVRVLVRDAAKGESFAKAGAQVSVGGLTDVAFLTKALQGAQGFFTLLPPDYAATDLFAAQKATSDAIAAAVKASGVKHVVMLSSIGADLDQGNGPIKGLNYLEKVLRATGTTLTAVRPGSFQENVHNVLGAARGAGIYPNLSLSADYAFPQIATKDIGAVAVEAFLTGPVKSEVIDVVGPSYSHRQVAEKLGRALGKTLQVIDIPQAGWADALKKAGVSVAMADALAEMYGGFAAGKIVPKGDRVVQGRTEIDEVIRAQLA